jgi:hypothetical protein
MTWAPTTDQILNLQGVRRRADRFRFELCDRDLRPIGDLHPDRGSTPSITNDTTSNTMRRLSGLRLMPDEAVDIDTFSHRLRVYMVLQNDVEYRLGTFLWADGNRPKRSWGSEHHGELVDYGFILDQPTTNAFGWGRGSNITLIMIFLLGRVGFELADLYPIGTEGARSLADPKTWEPGVTWRQMLVDLGGTVGFAPPWFDRDNKLHNDQMPDPVLGQPTIPAYGDDTRIIANSIVYSDDTGSAPNEWAVFDSGTGQLRVGRHQLPASAPHSFQNRGFRVGKVEQQQGMANQAIADKAAHNLARSSDAYEWLSFDTTLDPRHDTFDIIEAFGQRWLETSWSMELTSGGKMSHTMKRVSYDVT